VREQVVLTTGHISSVGNITLVSDATGTARIAPIGATASLIGNIEYQRYLNVTGKVYRYVSTPLANTTVANWMDYFRVTGNFTGSDNLTGGTSLWYYDNTVPGYVAFPTAATSEPFIVGRGYSLFHFEGEAPNTLRLNGPIQQQSFTYQNLAATENGWSLVGNQYASPFQWATTGWTGNGSGGTVSPSVYIRENIKVNGTTVTGIKWYNALTQMGGTSGPGNSETEGDYNGVIAQGQAFWVKSLTASPSLVISESAKYNALNATLFREQGPSNYLKITMSNGTLFDKSIILFHPDAQHKLEKDLDATKLDNSFFNISSWSSDSVDLVLDSRPANFCSENIRLNVKSTAQGNFALKFGKLNSFEYPVVIKLQDKFTGTETTISEGQVYNFSITSHPASKGSDRFVLTVAKPELNPNVTFSAASAEACGGDDVSVTLQNTQLGAKYQVMYGTNVLGEAIGNGNSISFNIQKDLLSNGSNALKIQGGFDGCDQMTFESTMNLSFVEKPEVSLVDGVLVSSHETGNQWMMNGEIIPGATGVTYIPQEAGDYSVSTTGQNCQVTSDAITFSITGMENPDQASFTLYPNPVKAKFLIKLPATVRENKRAEITLFSTNGVEVSRFRKTNKKEGIELTAEELSSGLYTIRVKADGQLLERRMIKE